MKSRALRRRAAATERAPGYAGGHPARRWRGGDRARRRGARLSAGHHITSEEWTGTQLPESALLRESGEPDPTGLMPESARSSGAHSATEVLPHELRSLVSWTGYRTPSRGHSQPTRYRPRVRSRSLQRPTELGGWMRESGGQVDGRGCVAPCLLMARLSDFTLPSQGEERP
jgi:hypothetical protein